MAVSDMTNSLLPAGETNLITFVEYGAGISVKRQLIFPSETATCSKKSSGYAKSAGHAKSSEKNQNQT